MPRVPAKRRAPAKRKSGGRKVATTKSVRRARPRATRKSAGARRAPATPRVDHVEPPSEAEEALFIDTLIQNGQAARPGEEGQSPDATHTIVEGADGKTRVVRRRFSIA